MQLRKLLHFSHTKQKVRFIEELSFKMHVVMMQTYISL